MTGTVSLIIPPSPFLLDERVFPFIGILKIAAVLERAGYPVEVVDLAGYSNHLEIIDDHVRQTKARHFGITATTPQFPAAIAIAERIRALHPNPKIIIGGTHATLVNAARRYEVLHKRIGRGHHAYAELERYFDVIVAGDGEETIFPALEESAPQLIDADDRGSPYFLNDERLDATPMPARHLLDLGTYKYSVDGAPATSLIAQLGCPYKCGFCAGRASPMLRNIRMRSDENIIEELVHLSQTYGYTGFMFYDDELNVNTGMIGLMEKIAQVQRDIGVTWKLRGFLKSERFNEAQADALWEAGFRQILIGFEAGSPRILKNIEKIATQENNTRCMDIARKRGLKVKALMSLGHPGESVETAHEMRDWLIEVCPSDFDVSVITPYPGSPYYDQALPDPNDSSVWIYTCKSGDRLYQREVNYALEADYYKGDPDDGYVSHVWTDHLASADLVRIRDDVERTVRKKLGIPFNPSRPAQLYEHSMGQTLPPRILRSSNIHAAINAAE